MAFLFWITTALILLLGAVYLFFKRSFSYWSRRNVPQSDPSFPLGDIADMGTRKNLGEVFQDLYHKFRNEKVVGLYMLYRPVLMVNDPEIIKNVVVSDFSNFHDHGVYYNEKDDPLSAHLFSINGAQWRNLRAKLSPTFTSGKMKLMFPILADVANKLQEILKPTAAKGEAFEAKDIIARFSTDIIASCAFGLDTNTLEVPNSLFREMGKKIFEPGWETIMRNSVCFFLPGLAEKLKLRLFPKDVSKFFLGTMQETMDYRKNTDYHRNDFLQLLMQLKEKGFIDDIDKKTLNQGERFTFEQAAAQAFIFFIGGFETSSSTLQFGLFELAKNQGLQNKLRAEILEGLKKTDGKMTYEGIHEFKYMGLVIEETLRKYAVGAVMTRECNKDYKLPGTELTIEKGTAVYISTMGLHTDPKYFPEPEKFIPDRFTEEEKRKRPNHVYMPFGDGPRFCIGQRFALMQMRVALTAILSKYRVRLGEKSPESIKYDPKSLILSPEGGMHIYVEAL